MNTRKMINQTKQDIAKHEKNIHVLLSDKPQLKSRFNAILRKYKNAERAARRYKSLGNDEETPWYKTDFAIDLFDFATTNAAVHQMNKDEQKLLQIELQQLEAKNSALDKQIALQQSLTATQKAKMFGGSFVDELLNSPVKIIALASLGYFLVKNRGKK